MNADQLLIARNRRAAAAMDEHATAIHEAGHAVAHVRLGVRQDHVHIIRNGSLLGAAAAEGAESVWSAEDASIQAVCYCAGYAALIAAGFDEERACSGADNDFEHVQHLVEFWGLNAPLGDWKARAVELMRQPQNVAAVRLLSEHLLEHMRLGADYIECLIELADGDITADEWAQFLALRAADQCGPRQG